LTSIWLPSILIWTPLGRGIGARPIRDMFAFSYQT
jgi:hypothetical protein